MKLAVDIFSDSFSSIHQDDVIPKNTYSINVDNDFNLTKAVKKGYWRPDKQVSFKEGVIVKPKKNFEVEDKDVKISLLNNLSSWTVKEVLQSKYQKKLSSTDKYSCVFYEEFIDEECPEFVDFKDLSFGKKICFGDGILFHNFELEDNKILFDCEYENEIPIVEIALDDKTFTRMKKFPFSQDFRKTQYLKICIKLIGRLTAYSIFFNGKIIDCEDFIGRGFSRKNED